MLSRGEYGNLGEGGKGEAELLSGGQRDRVPELRADVRMVPGLRGRAQGVMVGRAGLGGEIQKVKENPGAVAASRGSAGETGGAGSLTGECAGEAEETAGLVLGICPLPGVSAVLCMGLQGWSGLMREGQGLSPVLRVGSSSQGHQGQRGDRAPGPGSRTGAARHPEASRAPRPRVRSALIEVRLGEMGFGGDSTLLGAGRLGQTERWKRSSNKKTPA